MTGRDFFIGPVTKVWNSNPLSWKNIPVSFPQGTLKSHLQGRSLGSKQFESSRSRGEALPLPAGSSVLFFCSQTPPCHACHGSDQEETRKWPELTDAVTPCYRLNVFPPTTRLQNQMLKAWRPAWWYLEVRPWELIRFQWGHEGRTLTMQLVSL